MYRIEQPAHWLGIIAVPLPQSDEHSCTQARLEDRIRELCRQLAADDGTFDAGPAIAELRKALTLHALRISNKTAASVFTWPDFPKNRRAA